MTPADATPAPAAGTPEPPQGRCPECGGDGTGGEGTPFDKDCAAKWAHDLIIGYLVGNAEREDCAPAEPRMAHDDDDLRGASRGVDLVEPPITEPRCAGCGDGNGIVHRGRHKLPCTVCNPLFRPPTDGTPPSPNSVPASSSLGVPAPAEGTTAQELDYEAAARSIALNLEEFCDESLRYPDMIADAARKAGALVRRVEERLTSAMSDDSAEHYNAIRDALADIRATLTEGGQ